MVGPGYDGRSERICEPEIYCMLRIGLGLSQNLMQFDVHENTNSELSKTSKIIKSVQKPSRTVILKMMEKSQLFETHER